MTRAAILHALQEIVIDQLGVSRDQAGPDAQFDVLNIIDSLDAIEMVMAAEFEFGIDIPDGDVDHFKTIEDAVVYIERRITPGGQS
jgi:acyl carrier protein